MQTTALMLPASCAPLAQEEMTYLTGGAELPDSLKRFGDNVVVPAINFVDRRIVQPVLNVTFNYVILPTLNAMNAVVNYIGGLPEPVVNGLMVGGAALITTATLAPALLALPLALMTKGTPVGDWVADNFLGLPSGDEEGSNSFSF